jgi:hypothetical protein
MEQLELGSFCGEIDRVGGRRRGPCFTKESKQRASEWDCEVPRARGECRRDRRRAGTLGGDRVAVELGNEGDTRAGSGTDRAWARRRATRQAGPTRSVQEGLAAKNLPRQNGSTWPGHDRLALSSDGPNVAQKVCRQQEVLLDPPMSCEHILDHITLGRGWGTGRFCISRECGRRER